MKKETIKKLKNFALETPKTQRKEERERKRYEKNLSKLGTVKLITASSISGAIASELLRRALEYKPQSGDLNPIMQFVYNTPLLRWIADLATLIFIVFIFTSVTLWIIEKFNHSHD